MRGEDLLQPGLAGVATGEPKDWRGRAEAQLKVYEVAEAVVVPHPHHRPTEPNAASPKNSAPTTHGVRGCSRAHRSVVRHPGAERPPSCEGGYGSWTRRNAPWQIIAA